MESDLRSPGPQAHKSPTTSPASMSEIAQLSIASRLNIIPLTASSPDAFAGAGPILPTSQVVHINATIRNVRLFLVFIPNAMFTSFCSGISSHSLSPVAFSGSPLMARIHTPVWIGAGTLLLPWMKQRIKNGMSIGGTHVEHTREWHTFLATNSRASLNRLIQNRTEE